MLELQRQIEDKVILYYTSGHIKELKKTIRQAWTHIFKGKWTQFIILVN
jgi:hypothetical protein